MTKRQAVRVIVFICIAAGIFMGLNALAKSPQNADVVQVTRRFDEFYEDTENTWDGILIGSSPVDRGWAAPAAWHQYGMAVYALDTDAFPLMMTTSLLDEVQTRQDISFAAVELHALSGKNLERNGEQIRWVTEYIRSPGLKVKSIIHAFSYMDEWYPGALSRDPMSRLSYFFPILKFHSRLTEEETFYPGDFDSGQTDMKGVYSSGKRLIMNEVELEPYEELKELNAEQTALLDEIMAYCDEKGIQLVFYVLPSAVADDDMGEMNAACQYAEEKGYPVLNCQLPEVQKEIGMDGTTDFIDNQHLNIYGSRRFTDYFAAWLEKTLDIQDHGGDENYADWDEAWKTYKKYYRKSLRKMDLLEET